MSRYGDAPPPGTRVGGDAAPPARTPGGGLPRALRTAAIAAVGTTGITAAAAGGWYGYLTTIGGMTHEAALQYMEETAGGVVERVNRTFGEAQARAGAQIGLESVNATIEAIGQFLSQFGAIRNLGLGILNWAREAQGLERKIYVNGELQLVSEAAAAAEPAPAPADGGQLAATFNEQAFRTEFEGAVARTDLFNNMAPAIAHGGIDRATAITTAIQRLPLGELLDSIEEATPNQRVKDAIQAIEGDDTLAAAFDAARQSGDISSITAIFQGIANDQTTPAAAAVRAALIPTPPGG